LRAIEAELFRRRSRFEHDLTGLQRQATTNQLPGVQLRQQLIKRLPRRGELEDQFKRATAWQAEAMRLIGADAIAHHFWRAVTKSAAAMSRGVAMDQIVLNAAAGHAAHHATVVTQGHH